LERQSDQLIQSGQMGWCLQIKRWRRFRSYQPPRHEL